VDQAYEIYRSKDGVDSVHALSFREKNSLEITIKFIGVWDTVGALGVPLNSFADFNADLYSFHDTKLSSIVQNAYHAVAVDEHRAPYAATLWQPGDERDREIGQVIEQIWFSGVHSEVGGGYAGGSPVADLTLRWMQEKASSCGLGINIIDPPDESALLDYEIRDSFREFLKGSFSLFSQRYYRPVGRLEDGPQRVGDIVRKRVIARADYRPKNQGLCR
jgi:hypothetical protein